MDMERDLGRLGICLALLRGTDWADTSLHWDDTMEAESVRSDQQMTVSGWWGDTVIVSPLFSL